MKRILLFSLLLLFVHSLQAQELTVKRMEVAPMDLSASTQLRNDRNGNACALVKVQLATAGASFEGNVIGDAEFKKGEYWVYMSEGSYMLNVKHASFLPLFVNFRDYDIKRVEGKTTYVLTIAVPVQTQKLAVNYTPASAIVVIDSKPYQSNGHLELELPVGPHDYQIVAMGYETAEGSVKLSEKTPRTITEHLVFLSEKQTTSQNFNIQNGNSNSGSISSDGGAYNENVHKAFLGIDGCDLQIIIESEKEKGNYVDFGTTDGVYVFLVCNNTAAEEAGIRKGDIVIAIDGHKVTDFSELSGIIARKMSGSQTTISYMRDKKLMTTQVVLKGQQRNVDILSAEFREITKDQMKQLDITYGLEVVELYDGKMKAAGMPNNFIIQTANDQEMKTVDDLERVVKETCNSEDPVLRIRGRLPNGKRGIFAIDLR